MTERSFSNGNGLNGSGSSAYNGICGELTATVNELWVGGSDPRALAMFGLA